MTGSGDELLNGEDDCREQRDREYDAKRSIAYPTQDPQIRCML